MLIIVMTVLQWLDHSHLCGQNEHSHVGLHDGGGWILHCQRRALCYLTENGKLVTAAARCANVFIILLNLAVFIALLYGF